MLIGFSVSKCIEDILNKKVAQSDVLLIIGGTRFDDKSFDALIDGYRYQGGPWGDFSKTKIQNVLVTLYNQGKIHQPRNFTNGYAWASFAGGHWMRLVPEPGDISNAARKAWEHYVLLTSFDQEQEDD